MAGATKKSSSDIELGYFNALMGRPVKALPAEVEMYLTAKAIGTMDYWTYMEQPIAWIDLIRRCRNAEAQAEKQLARRR